MFKQLWISIAQLAIFTLAFALVMQGVVPFPFDVFLGFLGAVLLMYSISAIGEAVSMSRDVRMVRKANAGMIAKDGERFAAVGRLQPVGAPLRAPFSRRECVYYQYAATKKNRKASGERVAADYSGIALTRCMVKSPVRETRLFGVPVIKGFEDRTECLTAEEHYSNGERYVAESRFELASMGDLASVFQGIRTTMPDESGKVRRDVRHEQAGPITEMTLLETVVPTGFEVCVIGTWSADHGGLVQKFGSRELLTLYAGGVDGAVAELKKSMRTYFLGGGASLLLATGLVIWRLLAS